PTHSHRPQRHTSLVGPHTEQVRLVFPRAHGKLVALAEGIAPVEIIGNEAIGHRRYTLSAQNPPRSCGVVIHRIDSDIVDYLTGGYFVVITVEPRYHRLGRQFPHFVTRHGSNIVSVPGAVVVELSSPVMAGHCPMAKIQDTAQGHGAYYIPIDVYLTKPVNQIACVVSATIAKIALLRHTTPVLIKDLAAQPGR